MYGAWIIFISLLVPGFLCANDYVRLQYFEDVRIECAGFPQCCESEEAESIDLRVRNGAEKAAIMVWFLDLDLPPGSNLSFFEGSKYWSHIKSNLTHRKTLTQDKHGLWDRKPIVFQNNWVRVHFQPGPGDGIEHTGFVLMATADRGYCLHIMDIERGGRVYLKGKDLGEIGSLFGELRYDCVWQIRIPEHLKAKGMFAYANFNNTHFNGILRVYIEPYSDSFPMYEESGTQTLTQRFESKEGLFISISGMEVKEESNVIDFSYGLFKKLEEGERCSLGSTPEFVCKNSHWCIPFAAVCNNVTQCPGGEDEQRCDNRECSYEEDEKCDEMLHCADAMDEIGCHEAPKFEFDLTSITKKHKCYGKYCQLSETGAKILGGVIGGVALIVIIFSVARCYCQHSERQDREQSVAYHRPATM